MDTKNKSDFTFDKTQELLDEIKDRFEKLMGEKIPEKKESLYLRIKKTLLNNI
ncbi:MAG: hypothetical protein SLAVMIC_00066 [uncultured marine phage]|uniref:Uncharacterized protein n=1 Tax=uncultured marine phage TaxID=707152 RepID=A0A8D9CEJ5_9VIRU|nr:MAG: hypothetical protein SLAVMIC_00066 [uncultured marine phage]